MRKSSSPKDVIIALPTHLFYQKQALSQQIIANIENFQREKSFSQNNNKTFLVLVSNERRLACVSVTPNALILKTHRKTA